MICRVLETQRGNTRDNWTIYEEAVLADPSANTVTLNIVAKVPKPRASITSAL